VEPPGRAGADFGPAPLPRPRGRLPGIPSNVLAARLKDLQAAGVVTRRTLPAPTDVTVYELTGAVRHSTVHGDAEIARRALEPLAAALTRPAPAT